MYLIVVLLILISSPVYGQSSEKALAGTQLLNDAGDLSIKMVDGLHRFLDRALSESIAKRQRHWNRDYSSADAYLRSIDLNRRRFRKIIGLTEDKVVARLEQFAEATDSPLVAETTSFKVYQVRWNVLRDVQGEGLLLEPAQPSGLAVVALPDADQTPEQLAGLAPGITPESQFARVLAENGVRVLVPVLVNRDCDFSGNPDLEATRGRMTNQPHREWLYRMSYEMGRHLIGYEVHKILAAVDWFESEGHERIGVAGYGEGGLLAFYSAAVDLRIDAALVSGYFQPREGMYQQPIYRNVWSLLYEFGDAGIASLVFPRSLIIENSEMPQIDEPPEVTDGRRAAAAPGKIVTPAVEQVRTEFNRARSIWNRLPVSDRGVFALTPETDRLGSGLFGTKAALERLLASLGRETELRVTSEIPSDRRQKLDLKARQYRTVRQIEGSIQRLLTISDQIRDDFFLKQMPEKDPEAFQKAAGRYRKHFWEEVIGKVEAPFLPANPRTRLRYEKEGWTGYDVTLDVWEDVFAWGILLIPRDLKPGERRPVVVVQHGLEGLPQDVIETDVDSFRAYHAYGAQLADMGFIVYAPHNPYRGRDRFRQPQFKANPLKLSLFSFIVGQHRQTLDWLKTLPFVDRDRIGFYGLSYGGKTAMRIPAILEDYVLSICSGDFNEWIWKNVTVTWPNSYMFTGEYEMYEFDLGVTFNYAEMAYLIFPRPFMVERGHRDGVGIDEWVAYEYAKVRRLYDEMGLGDKTEIEFFNGVHEINGKGTFEFLRRHLNWPGK